MKKNEIRLLLLFIIIMVFNIIDALINFNLIFSTIIITASVIFIVIALSTLINYRKSSNKYKKLIRENKNNIVDNINVPYIIVNNSGDIISLNNHFYEDVAQKNEYETIDELINKTIDLNSIDENNKINVEINSKFYKVHSHKIISSESENFYIIYFSDETELRLIRKQLDDDRLIQGLIYIDNYDEVLSSTDESKRTILLFALEKKLRKYFTTLDAVIQKIDRDKYFVLIKYKNFKRLQSDKFSILELVKKIYVGNDIPITLSFGLVDLSPSYIKNYEQSVSAVDMALARGGDQAVFKTENKVYYYGGKSKSIEKNTRIKARVKAQALKTVIESREKVLIMGHKLADIDCVGAAIAMYSIAQMLDKEVHIVIDDIINSVRPSVNAFLNDNKYPKDMFITPKDSYNYINSDTTLIIVDVNSKLYTEVPDLIDLAGQVVVIDHHRKGENSITNAVLDYVESGSSSTCEMITGMLQYFVDRANMVDIKVLESLYAGILIDTNSFVNKVGVGTFEAAAYLKRSGVDIDKVRKMFREDSIRYKAKAQTISDAYEFRKGFVIGVLYGDELDSATELGAQAANELLNIEGITASIILTKIGEIIYVSFRSIDDVNVQIIAEQLGGGGHQRIAGAQFHGINIDEAKIIIINKINEMISEREI